MASYPLDASPTLYSGQTVHFTYQNTSRSTADDITITPVLRYYDSDDETITLLGEPQVAPSGTGRLAWGVPPMNGQPILEIGLVVEKSYGNFFLTSVDWTDTPTAELVRPAGNGVMWRRSWVSETDFVHPDLDGGIRLISNGGRRLAMTGTADWVDYSIEATLTPHAAAAVGLAVRVQGRRRYYLLRLTQHGEAQLIRRNGADDSVIARIPVTWRPGEDLRLRVDAHGSAITAYIGDHPFAWLTDPVHELSHGGVALMCEAGRVDCASVRITPIATPVALSGS
jgi:hypothetical protein